ncbi:hypothetical protein C8J56DRAFT_963488 [Mycena floridula]|nr:hypothetical protein C8J56DRAFT_963488 [Mycena floridula]
MTSAIVLPRLSAWTEGHVQALFTAKTEADFENAFDEFLAKDVSITVNGAQAGSVGLFYTATINETIRVRDAPVQKQVVSSLNVVIDQDPTLHPPTLPGRGFFDGRRVFKLDEVTTTGGVA